MKDLPAVSIAIPYYNGKETITKVVDALKKQDYTSDVEIIIIDDKSPDKEAKEVVQKMRNIKLVVNENNLGLANSMNVGIKTAKYYYVVTLHHDSIPSDKNWLKHLMEPFKDQKVIASVSRNHLARSIWEQWTYWHRALTANEVKSFYPSLDGRSTAFKKSVVMKYGLYDGKTFRTSGEDVDLYFKMKNDGIVAHPDAEIIHLQGQHRTSFYKQLRREFQYGEGNGANIRRHKLRIFHSTCRIALETVSLLSIVPFYFISPKVSALGALIFLILSNIAILPWQLKNLNPDLRNLTLPFVNFLARSVYTAGAIKGFITGRQDWI